MTENVPLPQKAPDKTSAYIELIQALLDCPEGAEKSILEQHQDLIGPELVKVMKQVASQIAAEGNESTANFLNILATDLNRTWLQNHQFQPTLKKEIAPAPWFEEEDTSPPDKSETDTQPTNLEAPQVAISEMSGSSPPSPIDREFSLRQQLTVIADCLSRLETTLASRIQPFNPLWYMEVLEKAETANWILTTDEVEHLIGIKPHCHHDETFFHRGSWVFVKAGKIGAQTGWRVHKTSNSVS